MSDAFDPVSVLGCSAAEARSLLAGKKITPGEVESVALSHYHWRAHLADPQSYWVTTSQAARILHLSPQQVKHRLDAGRLPHQNHASGVRLMRRRQIEELAAAGPR